MPQHKIKKLSMFEVALCEQGMNAEAVISIHKAGQRPAEELPAGGKPGETVKKEGLMPGEVEKIAALEAAIVEKDKALNVAKAALETAATDLAKAKKDAEDAKAEADALKKAADIAKSDEVITVEGQEVRKSVVGETMFKVTKAQAERIEMQEFAKAAEGPDYGALAGEPLAKAKALRAISKMGEEDRKATEAMLKGGAEAMRQLMNPVGGAPRMPENFAKAADKFDALVKAHMEKHSVDIGKATDAVSQTKEGAAAYEQMQKERTKIAA